MRAFTGFAILVSVAGSASAVDMKSKPAKSESKVQSVDDLIRQLKSPLPDRRRDAARQLGAIGAAAEPAIAALKSLADDPNDFVRKAAAEAAGKIAEAVKSEAAKSKSDGAEPGQATSGEPEYEGKPLSYWIRQLRSAKDSGFEETLTALSKFGPENAKTVVPELVAAWKRNPLWKFAIPSAFAVYGDGCAKAAGPLLLEGLKSKDPSVRIQSAAALGKMPSLATESAPAIGRIMRQDAENAYDYAPVLSGLGEAGAAELAKCLSDKSERVRSPACAAIGECGAAAEKHLVLLDMIATSDADRQVRAAAKISAEKIRDAVKAKAGQ